MRLRRRALALYLTVVLLLPTACSNDPSSPDENPNPGTESPDDYPPIPRPQSPNDVIPDESERYSLIVPLEGKAVDFAPTWSDAVMLWDVDVQTWHESIFGNIAGDPVGDYYRGTRRFSQLVFEGGNVDLTTGVPASVDGGRAATRRLLFLDGGSALATPRNPQMTQVRFIYVDSPSRSFDPALYAITRGYSVSPARFESYRWRFYNTAGLGSPPLASSVYLMRERYWRRLTLGGDGNNLKSIRVDPGTSFTVSYTRTNGTSTTNAYTFTRSLNAEITAQLPSQVLGAKLGGSLSEAFETSVEISEESSVTIERNMTGIDGQTVIYSVWASVEAYSIVDVNGNPFTDPNYTFDDLGNAAITGEYEWISSTAFDYE